jgi:hypothetical protein
LILCTTTAVIAQSTDATVSGLVLDPSGRVIPNADIEILNESTGVIYSGRTNETGIYTVSLLPPGQYRLQVSKIGFKSLIKPGIVLNVQSAVALNFTLPIGATSETVTVDAGASSINTTDASVSTVIDRKFVENIPLNGRSFQDLISMTPGVVTQSPQAGSGLASSGDFSVNGQRTETNYYTVDGVTGNTLPGNGYGSAGPGTSGSLSASTALGTTQSLISVDALQEFRIESSTYSAEYGRTPGGQISLVTRSGTNEINGSIFDYLRNSFFDANDWFNDHYGQPLAALRQNDFGGTIGGPVWIPRVYEGKKKTFFFFSFEGLRLIQPKAASVQYVPDTFLREQAPLALQSILDAYPLQNGIDYGNAESPGLAQFYHSYSLPSTINSTSIRGDHQFNSHSSIFVRYSDTPSSTTTRLLSSLSTTSINFRTYTLGATNVLSSKISNDFRLGYTRSDSLQNGQIDSFGGAVPLDLTGAMAQGSHQSSEPYFLLDFAGIGSTPLFYAQNAGNRGQQWNIVDTLSISAGRHQFKFGVDYRRIASPTAPSSLVAEALFFSPESVLSNSAAVSVAANALSATPLFNETAVFAEDEWKLSPNLNLSLGLRWEADPPPTEAHGNDAYTLLGTIGNPQSIELAPEGTPLWKTSWYNFAPRLGLAWTVRGKHNWETVLHTGAGVFFDTNNQNATQGFQGIGFDADRTFYGSPLPLLTSQVDFPVSPSLPYTDVYAFPDHLQPPYTLQWNVSLEQAIGKSQAATISYVGANGRRLVGNQELELGSINPEFGLIIYPEGGVTSNYQALQVKFQRSVAKGLHALASYTWSHSIDFGSNDAALPLTRGNSDYDVRSNFVGGLSWEIPTIGTNTRVHNVLSNWGIDSRLASRSGFPITLEGNYLINPANGSSYYGNLNLIPDTPLYLYGPQYPGKRALNSAAFSDPEGNGAGDAPRNLVRGFGATQVNLAIRRDFPLHDQFALQFRAETFNIMNHPNFGYVDPYLTDATFGQATMMLNSSLGTMASQYQQGGPRSMQFALKIVF